MNTRSRKRQAWEVPEGQSFWFQGEVYLVIHQKDEDDGSCIVRTSRGEERPFNTFCVVDLVEEKS